jgi:hypothetical protein
MIFSWHLASVSLIVKVVIVGDILTAIVGRTAGDACIQPRSTLKTDSFEEPLSTEEPSDISGAREPVTAGALYIGIFDSPSVQQQAPFHAKFSLVSLT